GSLDLSFTNINFDGDVNSIVIRTNGQLQVKGGFSAISGSPRKNIALLNADGSLDPNFKPGSGVTSGTASTFVIQPDGKVIIGGGFTTNNPVAGRYIARVNPDESLDPTFDAGYIGGSYVISLALQPDGKVIVGEL